MYATRLTDLFPNDIVQSTILGDLGVTETELCDVWVAL